MIPFFIYYSMFGFQRIGDLMWLAGDIRAKGFLVGGTAGRTTLNGEGLQHQDGHSHVLASTIPSVITYDPAFRFEIAVIVEDGLRRMYENGEEVYYYLTVGNENYKMPEMPEGVEEGILRGLYKFKEGEKLKKPVGEKVHLFGSGSILNEALRAQEILADKYNVSADVWSATNYKRLRYETLECQRWNMLNPDKKAKTSYLQDVLSKEKGTFVAASDNMRIVPEQIQQWVPGGLFALGTDGFGRSESREALRRYFEVDAESIVIGTLYSLSQKGKVETKLVKKAIKDLGVDPEKTFPKWS
jgi:pyruvate dehydrogenase E1 component